MPFKLETPAIDPIFSLDCLKLNEMKKLFKTIFANLQHLNFQVDSMPDVTDVMARLTKVEMEQGSLRETMNKKFKDAKADHDKYADGIREKLSDFNIRITKLENVGTQQIDYDELFDRDEFKSLKRQIQMIVDTTSVNSERLIALETYNEKTLRPLLNEDFGPRIVGLEDRMALMEADLLKKLDET